MVNLVLKYMAKINYAAVKQIRNIFAPLINYQGFEHYLEECPFQTLQMESKQTLKIKRKEDDEIVQAQPHKCSYVDEDYFKGQMGENKGDPNYLTYAVEVFAVRADWILNEDIGLNFLQELLKQQRKDIFETRYIKIIIQFLYNKYSRDIKRKLLPFYIPHIISVLLMIYCSEQYRDDLKAHTIKVKAILAKADPKDRATAVAGLEPDADGSLKTTFQVICALINITNLVIISRQSLFL